MKLFRAIRRAIALSCLSLGIYLLWLLGRPFCAPERAWRWRNTLFTWWAKGAATIIHLQVTVEGQPPHPPYLLVANHLSYVDLVLLAGQLKGGIFVSKSEVADWPMIGLMARSSRMIFINRNRLRDIPRVLIDMEELLGQQQGIILFPESTTSCGETVLPFYSSLLQPAVKLALPTHYVSVTYRTQPPDLPAYLAVCWWGDMTFLDHVFALFQLSTIEAKLVFGVYPPTQHNRKQLAKQLHQAISQQFTPTIEGESAKNAKKKQDKT